MKKKEEFPTTFPSVPILEEPENVSELLNKYGTYEIQPTADTENMYPAISQGLARKDRNIERDQKT